MEYLESEDNVEAIEEGKIVKVSERYAKREGLPILRRPTPKIFHPKKQEEEKRISFDDLRKPLNWRKSQVFSELIENFHWEISKKRRQIGLSRKQLALDIKESENTIKLVENGILPKDDFKIINKIQERLNINLRKDNKNFNEPVRPLIENEEEKLSRDEVKFFDE